MSKSIKRKCEETFQEESSNSKTTFCLICYNSFIVSSLKKSKLFKEGGEGDCQKIFERFISVLESKLFINKSEILNEWDFSSTKDFLPFCSNCLIYILNISKLQLQLEQVQSDISSCLDDIKYVFINSLSSYNQTKVEDDSAVKEERIESFRNKAIQAWNINEADYFNINDYFKKSENIVIEPNIKFDEEGLTDNETAFDDNEGVFSPYQEVDEEQNNNDDLASDDDGIIHLPDPEENENKICRKSATKARAKLKRIAKKIIKSEDNSDDSEIEYQSEVLIANQSLLLNPSNRIDEKFFKCIKVDESDSSDDETDDENYQKEIGNVITEPKSKRRRKREAKIPEQYLYTDIVRLEDGKLMCGNCSIVEEKIKNLKKHIRTQHFNASLKRDYMCSLCGKILKNLGSISRHKKIYHSNNPPSFPCNLCHKALTTMRSLRRHQAFFHGQGIEYVLSCNICGRPFNLEKDLKAHVWTHLSEEEKIVAISKGEIPPENGFICSECGKILSSEVSLKKHEMIHKGIKPFTCHICGWGFRHKANLLSHVQTHNPDESMLKFVCLNCPKKFRTKTQLNKHSYTHNKELSRPHKCPYPNCNQSFTHSSSLKYHIYSHTGERPFGCNICGKNFTREFHVNRHLKNVHNIIK